MIETMNLHTWWIGQNALKKAVCTFQGNGKDTTKEPLKTAP